jgi:diacylglycerol O-acyltransferase / wax synthase
VVLAVVVGVLRDLLEQRGERLNSLVVSVMVSAPRAKSADAALGNAVGVIAADLPAGGHLGYRVEAIAGVMRDRKASARGSSAAVVTPLFRALRTVGLLRRFINRQHMVNTIVTNMRGPDERWPMLGVQVTDAVVLSSTAGNLTAAFAVLSYAGRLNVTIIADPDACPDWRTLADRLQAALDEAVLAAFSR